MTIGRVVWSGTKAALALTVAVIGLTWLNQVAAAVMDLGGSCASGGPYQVTTPCPEGVWMAPAGIFGGLAAVFAYLVLRPAGSPALGVFAWPALFGSLGFQFLRAAAAEENAWGFWLCGVLFVAMAAAPLVAVWFGDRRSLLHALIGSGVGDREVDSGRSDPRDPWRDPPPAVDVILNRSTPTAPRRPRDLDDFVDLNGDHDLAESLDRLARLHQRGDLSDAEFADAKQQVLDGA